MAVEMLFDAELERACFFCNTEGRPFGPAFFVASRDDAYGFLHFLEVGQGQDPRKLEADVLHTLFRLWENKENKEYEISSAENNPEPTPSHSEEPPSG